MKGRNPTAYDIQRMKEALELVTAYDLGVEEQDFGVFMELVKSADRPEAMIQPLAQFAWLLLKSMHESGMNKQDILAWYGMRFEEHVQRLNK